MVLTCFLGRPRFPVDRVHAESIRDCVPLGVYHLEAVVLGLAIVSICLTRRCLQVSPWFFLRELDGMASGDSDACLLLLDANPPFDIDTAVLRRVPLRILIDLPTCDDRLAILKILLTVETLGLDIDEPIASPSRSAPRALGGLGDPHRSPYSPLP